MSAREAPSRFGEEAPLKSNCLNHCQGCSRGVLSGNPILASVIVPLICSLRVPLPSQTGLKQGCPLSPTLFGIFVDGLFHYLDTHCPEDGILLGGGIRVRILGYADDFVLVSNSPAGLQRLSIELMGGVCLSVCLLVS